MIMLTKQEEELAVRLARTAVQEFLILTHKNAEVDIVKRICQRYDAVIEGLKKVEK